MSLELDRKRLSNEQKLEIMKRYIEETGEKIHNNTQFEGYNIGMMKNNLRQLYHEGKLHMDETLLKEFMEYGIILEEKERIRTSPQEKYEFLMSTIGKNPEELKELTMRNGMTYTETIRAMQADYNRGVLRLEPEQIETLKKNRLLKHLPQEKEKLIKELSDKYNLPGELAWYIEQQYACESRDEFLKLYKSGKINDDFIERFSNRRVIAVSEKDITEEKKKRYVKLIECIFGVHELGVNLETYINIDRIEKTLSLMRERERTVLELRYGLVGEKCYSLEEVGEKFRFTRERIRQIENKALRIMKKGMFKYKNGNDIGENINVPYQKTEKLIKNINHIITYITNPDGTLKQDSEIEDIKLSDLGIEDLSTFKTIDESTMDKPKKNITLFDLVNGKTRIDINGLKLEDLNLSFRTLICLKKAGINEVSDLIGKTDDFLMHVHNLGKSSYDEIIETIQGLGLEYIENEDGERTISCSTSKIDANEQGETKQSGLSKLLNQCTEILQEQSQQFDEMKLEKARYEEAKRNYLENEDIFDKNAIIKGYANENDILQQEEQPLYDSEEKNSRGTGSEEVLEDNNIQNEREEKVKDSIDSMSTDELEEEDRKIQEEIEKTKKQLEEKRKAQLKESIEKHKKELDELKEELQKIENSQTLKED